MRELTHIVECKSSLPFYEVIAAFNCESVARDYARECARVNRQFAYRVVSAKREEG
jgi:hypothetical protein